MVCGLCVVADSWINACRASQAAACLHIWETLGIQGRPQARCGRLEVELNTASDYDNDSREDDCCTTSDYIAWRDHTDSVSIVRGYSVWNLIRDSLCPPDVLRLCTVGRGGTTRNYTVTLPHCGSF